MEKLGTRLAADARKANQTRSRARPSCTEQLPGHLRRAIDNGVTVDELTEAITHLAFYAGWPTAMSAVMIAKKLFEPADGAASPS